MSSLTTLLRFLVRGGPTAKAAADTPLARELLLDTTTGELRYGDGATPGGLPLTVGTPTADCVLKSDTRLGTIGNIPLTTTALTPADWAALPVGWSGIISADVSVASGLPAADVYHLHKISSRDVSGGAAYQAMGYLTPALHVGVAATSADLPTWSKVLLGASTVGASLLSLSTPAAAKIPRINADGSVTLIDVPSGGGSGGDMLEQVITASTPKAWWKADAGVLTSTGVAAGVGDSAATWLDQSGHGYHLSGSATVISSKLPVLSLNGTSDCFYSSSFPSINQKSLTVVAVFQQRTAVDRETIVALGASGAGNIWGSPYRCCVHCDTSDRVFTCTFNESWAGISGAGATPWGVWSARNTDGSIQISKNALTSVTTSSANAASYPGVLLGAYWSGVASNFSHLDMAEVLIWDRPLPDGMLATISDLLRVKWGI